MRPGTHTHRPRTVRVVKGWDRARTTLRVEAQRCSGQAVKGLSSAAPVQELQPGTPVTTSPERLGGAFASKARTSYLAKALSTANSEHRGGVQGAGCLRQHQRAQHATSAQHSSAKRPSADRAPSRGPSASIINDREAAQAKRSRTKGPHGRSAGHRHVRTRRVERHVRTVPRCKG